MKNQIYLTLFVLLLFEQQLAGQSTTPGNIWSGNTNEFIGWDITPTNATPLFIKHELNYPIRFYTDAANGVGLFNNQRMIIDHSPGHVGIGLNFSPGNDVLDLLPDNNFPNTGIGINNETVLHNWGQRNMFVGVGAGASNGAAGIDNTFVGFNAGVNNDKGYSNTFFGSKAGMSNKDKGGNTYIGWLAGSNFNAAENTFVGSRSGEDNTGQSNTFMGVLSGFKNVGEGNVFIGSFAGQFNSGRTNTFLGNRSGMNFSSGDNNFFGGNESGSGASGNENVFIGFRSGNINKARYNVFVGSGTGLNNTDGAQNTFVGKGSGQINDHGNGNTFLGYEAGISNQNGSLNTFVGSGSGNGVATGTINSAAIGANATVLNNNSMILGAIDVNVGIGMSGVLGGPLTKLQILSKNVPQFRISYDYGNNIHTDFQTTASGDLKINPTGHFTGFDLSVSPANVVDINSSSSAISGLRLRNLSTTSNSNGKVLSVDNSGDVILVRDNSIELIAMIKQLQQQVNSLQQKLEATLNQH